MRLITWNTARRRARLQEQLAFLESRKPDIAALQEVTPGTLEFLEEGLLELGLEHVRCSLPSEGLSSPKRRMGVLVASRWPLGQSSTLIDSPWPEKALSASVAGPGGPVGLHMVHVPPGSSNGWVKVDVLEAVYGALARPHDRPTIL